MIQAIVAAQNIPTGTCYSTEQERLTDYANKLVVTWPATATLVVTSSSTPAVSDQDKTWVRLNVDGSLDGVYTFFNGQWASPHPLQPGDILLWGGDISTIATKDGGAAGTVSQTTGPFWEELTDARGRSPMHPGTLDSGATLAVLGTMGEEKHLQTKAEVGIHRHTIEELHLGQRNSGGGTVATRTSTDPAGGFETEFNQETAEQEAFNVVHPVYGLYLIRRTARIYKVV